MVGKKTSKRSIIYKKGTNATIDQFFTIQKKPTEESATTTTNENETKNIPSPPSDSSKQLPEQEKKNVLSPASATSLLDKKATESTSTKQQRRPLADLGGKSSHALMLMPTKKPAKPTFAVLRDDDIEQGATEVDNQQTGQSILSPTLPTDESNTQQQTSDKANTSTAKNQTNSALDENDDDDDDDTQDSQASSFGRPMGSPDSFFDDDDDNNSNSGVEFCVDALDTDDDDDNSDDHATTSFFDDDEAPFLTKTNRRTHFPTPITPTTTTLSIPNKRPLDGKNENETDSNKMIKGNPDNTKSPPAPSPTPLTPLPSSNTEENDNQDANRSNSTMTFSISNSLTIPLDINDNYHSEDDDDPTSASPGTLAIQQSPAPQQRQNSLASRISDSSTLPMSLPTDESLDLHVAYPVPRGKHVTDKFGH